MSLCLDGSTFQIFKVFRLFRVLRPLRVISRNEGLKVAVSALINAIPDIFNVLIICLLFFLLFGIFGVNYFKGMYYSCNTENIDPTVISEIKDRQDCLNYGGEWMRMDAHFDNVLAGMMTLFEIASTEGWINIMYNGVDAVGIDEQPHTEG